MTQPATPIRSVVVIQWNRKSGSGKGRGELIVLSQQLRRTGYLLRMFSNRTRLDAYIRGRFNADGASLVSNRQLKCIVAAGGDGTVADVVNRHPRVPIAVLPLGTENLLARFLGMTCCGRQVADAILNGSIRWLDTAMANDHRFLLMFSSGLDAEVVSAIHAVRTGTIRKLTYIVPVLKAFMRSRPRTYRATSLDGKMSVSGSHLIVTNIPRYGFGLPFAPNAKADDGLLDVRALQGKTRLSIFWHALKLKLGLPVSDREVHRFEASEVTMSCDDSPGLTQADGDPGPELPVKIRVESRSLCVITPREL